MSAFGLFLRLLEGCVQFYGTEEIEFRPSYAIEDLGELDRRDACATLEWNEEIWAEDGSSDGVSLSVLTQTSREYYLTSEYLLDAYGIEVSQEDLDASGLFELGIESTEGVTEESVSEYFADQEEIDVEWRAAVDWSADERDSASFSIRGRPFLVQGTTLISAFRQNYYAAWSTEVADLSALPCGRRYRLTIGNDTY